VVFQGFVLKYHLGYEGAEEELNPWLFFDKSRWKG
jgi:hypothetical protein